MFHPRKIATVVELVWLVCKAGVATQKVGPYKWFLFPLLPGTTVLRDRNCKMLSSWDSSEG